MGWAPALDLKALTVLYIKEEPNKVQKLLRDSTFPIPLVKCHKLQGHAHTCRALERRLSGSHSCMWAPPLQSSSGMGSLALTLSCWILFRP